MAESAQKKAQRIERRVMSDTPDSIRVESPAFQHGRPLPDRFAMEGEDVSPPLSWRGVPERANGLALVVDDPDAPSGLFTHWTAWNIPLRERGLPEGASRTLLRSMGASEGKNDFGNIGWNGPRPPSGTHRYYFRVYAVDTQIDLGEGASPGEVWDLLQQHALAWGEIMGTFTKR